jgi:signal transduction histidine kinase
LAASWLSQHIWILVTDPPWSALTHAFLYLIGFLGAIVFLVWFFIEWTSAFEPPERAAKRPVELALRPWPHDARRRLGFTVAAVMPIGAALMIWRLSTGDQMVAIQDIDSILGFLGLAAMAYCLARLVAHIARGGMREPIEMASFLVVILAAIADIVMVRFFSSYGVFLGVAAAFFPLALMISLAGRARSIFEAATATADRLNALVGQREQEIVANLQELQRRERATLLLEERARIMRDMHDGIGGQLLGLVLQAKANKLSGEKLVEGLEESLSDLRVIVDSLEQGDGSLATVLGAFRARIEPRVEAAGAQLIWEIGDVGDAPSFGPDRALQLYRILQEACTNALKHGQPRRIAVKLTRDDGGRIELSLSDDGKGFDAANAASGRGLSNMRYRAERIGAQLRIATSGTGTRISLQL